MKNKKHRTLDYVQHMYQAINEILEYTKDMDYSSFLSNDILQKAICWNFNVIGEASRNIQKMILNISKKIQGYRGLTPMKCETILFMATGR